jgi:REP element-mobilizing transposase RayT
MPRKNLIRTNTYFYHVTTRSNHKQWFSIPLADVWNISIQSMKLAQDKCPAIVSQYVLMSNHYHMLIRTPNCDVDRFMYWFNKTFSELLREKSGAVNRMFGSRYKWSVIKSDRYFYNVFRYIYQNPVRAGLVEKCHKYPYSSHYYQYYGLDIGFPFAKLDHLEGDICFLNYGVNQTENLRIKKGLSRSIFKEVFSQ